jgi:hypothetical protein
MADARKECRRKEEAEPIIAHPAALLCQYARMTPWTLTYGAIRSPISSDRSSPRAGLEARCSFFKSYFTVASQDSNARDMGRTPDAVQEFKYWRFISFTFSWIRYKKER